MQRGPPGFRPGGPLVVVAWTKLRRGSRGPILTEADGGDDGIHRSAPAGRAFGEGDAWQRQGHVRTPEIALGLRGRMEERAKHGSGGCAVFSRRGRPRGAAGSVRASDVRGRRRFQCFFEKFSLRSCRPVPSLVPAAVTRRLARRMRIFLNGSRENVKHVLRKKFDVVLTTGDFLVAARRIRAGWRAIAGSVRSGRWPRAT